MYIYIVYLECSNTKICFAVFIYVYKKNSLISTGPCKKLVPRYISLFSSGTLVSFTNKTDHHDIAEIFMKVALDIFR